MDSHAGAARFAYNTMLAVVKANLDQRSAERSYGIDEGHLTPALGWSFPGFQRSWRYRPLGEGRAVRRISIKVQSEEQNSASQIE
ncbi:MAG: hypothetical protein ACXWD3_07595, partial [Mycobacterium sp.]